MTTLIAAETLHKELPITLKTADFIAKTRTEIKQIIHNVDPRLLIVVGPCSIHHYDSAYRYAEKLQPLIKKYKNNLCIVMRTYLEKARTSVGWKGFINDPHLNNTFAINDGLRMARTLLRDINNLGVPTAAEILNPLMAHYYSDFLSWTAIGARTTESQLHREFASDLPIPVGFKNNTNGDIQVAIDAIRTANQSHYFLGLDLSGKTIIQHSRGNLDCHVILRGSNTQSNYDRETIHQTVNTLKHLYLPHKIMIDCSHGNAIKNYSQQIHVINTLADQIKNNLIAIGGIMIESHLMPGKQAWNGNALVNSDQSITDACLGWDETESALDTLSEAVQLSREIA